MPLIQIYLRQGVVKSKEQKAKMIDKCSQAIADVIADDNLDKSKHFKERTTVNIIELDNENWGLKGQQYEPGKQYDDKSFHD